MTLSLLFITTAIITSTMKKKKRKKSSELHLQLLSTFSQYSQHISHKKKPCLKFVRRTIITGRDKQNFIIMEVLRFDLYGHFVAVDTCFELSWVESHSGQNDWVGVGA